MSKIIQPTKSTKGSAILMFAVMIIVSLPFSAFQGFINKEETITIHAKVLPTNSPSPTPERKREIGQSEKVEKVEPNQEVKELIEEVFGKHADKAFKVLSCENASLNPKAINTAGNTPKGSRDMGVFQINEYWQGVNGKFLLDPELNVRIAWKIYKDNGYSFERWTCGRKLGI